MFRNESDEKDAAEAAMALLTRAHGIALRGVIIIGDCLTPVFARLGIMPLASTDASDANVLALAVQRSVPAALDAILRNNASLEAVVVLTKLSAPLALLDRVLFDCGWLRLADPPGAAAPQYLLYLRSARIADPHATGGRPRGTVMMSNLGHNAGFANQLFQYAFLKLYGLRNNAAIETPAWVGEDVYGISPHHVARRRRMVKGDEWSVRDLALWESDNPPIDVDFWGYYQNVPPTWRHHRAFLRRLFEPRPAWRVPVERWLARHRPPGKTLVAIHLRRGDYQRYDPAVKPWFRVIPEDWYLRWLGEIWPSLANPVLFVATDDHETVLPRFAAYAPLTAHEAEEEMPEPRYLADFEIMAHADLLAISNSSFSRMAALLAPATQRCFIPAIETASFVPYEPWASDHFWQRFGAPATRSRSLLPRWLRRLAP